MSQRIRGTRSGVVWTDARNEMARMRDFELTSATASTTLHQRQLHGQVLALLETCERDALFTADAVRST
jgi:hypothetical protein